MVSMTYVQEDDDDFKCRVEQFDELLAVALVVGAAAHGTPSPYHAESCIFTAICITTAYAKWENMHREWMHQIGEICVPAQTRRYISLHHYYTPRRMAPNGSHTNRRTRS
jgi:hypothetical protein